MSTFTLLLLLLVAGVAGIAIGYYLRWIISLGQKGSMELDIKQKLLEARTEAEKIVLEAEKRRTSVEEEIREGFKAREDTLAAKDSRLGEKEQLLDRRQIDIDKEAERIKAQIEQVKQIKERADALIVEREKAVEAAAHLSQEEAKEEVLKTVERNSEEDILVRMQKLEIDGKERLDAKAREILTTAIHRMGNSVHADVLT